MVWLRMRVIMEMLIFVLVMRFMFSFVVRRFRILLMMFKFVLLKYCIKDGMIVEMKSLMFLCM